MTLHDAERAGLVGEFDKVILRVYSLVARRGGGGAALADGKDGDRGPSKSVLDPDSDGDDGGTSDGDDDEGEVGNGARGRCDDDASNDRATAAMETERR